MRDYSVVKNAPGTCLVAWARQGTA
uniref:Uncharacterized protein n=1 Tax=Rhizophora mucronata TaxID=61149 RepID=A0A2P2PXP7_RHIMU